MANRKTKIRDGAAKFDLLFNDEQPEVFVEGLAQIMIGAPLSKIVFYTTKGVDSDGVEQRYANQTLVMPTNAVVQMISLISQQFATHEKEILKTEAANSEQLKSMLAENSKLLQSFEK